MGIADCRKRERESNNEIPVFQGVLVILLLSSGIVYYLIFRHYNAERLSTIYRSSAPINLSTAKVLYTLWFVFYICIILIAAFMTIFSAL